MAAGGTPVHFSTAVHPFLPAPLHPGYDEGVFNRSPPSKSAAVPDWSVPTQSRRPHLAAALTLVAEVGSLTYEPFIREELGRLRGDESELREAVRLYAAIGATGHARRLSTELAGSLPPASAAPGEPGLLE